MILLDYGHGGRDPGSVYRGRREADDNLRVGQALGQALRDLGLDFKETRQGDSYLSLGERVRLEGLVRPRLFLSLHRNSSRRPGPRGLEIYYHKDTSQANLDLAWELKTRLLAYGFRDRGLRPANFYVLRKTRAPALLLELGFINSQEDNEILDGKLGPMTRDLALGLEKFLKV